jgi:hypothetical protein
MAAFWGIEALGRDQNTIVIMYIIKFIQTMSKLKLKYGVKPLAL